MTDLQALEARSRRVEIIPDPTDERWLVYPREGTRGEGLTELEARCVAFLLGMMDKAGDGDRGECVSVTVNVGEIRNIIEEHNDKVHRDLLKTLERSVKERGRG